VSLYGDAVGVSLDAVYADGVGESLDGVAVWLDALVSRRL
jgi:hypothetical protein